MKITFPASMMAVEREVRRPHALLEGAARGTFGCGEASEERMHGGGELAAVDLAFKLPQKKEKKRRKGESRKKEEE